MNGTSKLQGWVIALVGGRAFIGRAGLASDVTARTLSPVFDLQSGFAQTPQGMARPCMAMPVLGLASIREITVPKDAIVIDIAGLSAPDKEALGKAIEMGMALLSDLKRAESGLVVAPPGTKLPPFRGAQ